MTNTNASLADLLSDAAFSAHATRILTDSPRERVTQIVGVDGGVVADLRAQAKALRVASLPENSAVFAPDFSISAEELNAYSTYIEAAVASGVRNCDAVLEVVTGMSSEERAHLVLRGELHALVVRDLALFA